MLLLLELNRADLLIASRNFTFQLGFLRLKLLDPVKKLYSIVLFSTAAEVDLKLINRCGSLLIFSDNHCRLCGDFPAVLTDKFLNERSCKRSYGTSRVLSVFLLEA